MVSIWEQEAFLDKQDVTIIGSGFTGLWTAFHLKRKVPKMRISVLERGWLPAGASTRNAGFACFGSLSELVADGNQHGQEEMLKLVQMRYDGLQLIRKHFAEAARYESCGGYELFHPHDSIDKQKLDHDIQYINSLIRDITGKKQTFRSCDDRMGQFGFEQTTHLVYNPLEGALHSGFLLAELLKEVQGMGVNVLANTNVKHFQPEEDGIRISTDHAELHCKRVVICTNAFAKDLIDTDVVPARGQVLLTSPITDLKFTGTFHAEQGYYYFRNLGNRVLLGGARNKDFVNEATTEVAITNKIQEELERYLREIILPTHRNEYSIDYRWAGIMGMGGEKLPIVKEAQPNVFCGVRMSGMGVALAPKVGKDLSRMIIQSL